jgi:GNAT superfamily N-acetyltransferase
MSMHLRPMTRDDIPAGLRLCRLSHWNQLESDWHSFLESPLGAGWLVERDGDIVGTVAVLRYRPGFSWLSMMLVDPRARHSGIGSQLLETALHALAEEPCVRLDATPAGEPLYRRHGFVPEYALTRAKITVAAERFRRSPETVCPITPGDLTEVLARDREVFGADRSALLASFYARAPELAWIARNPAGDRPAGPTSLPAYCFGRPGYRYGQIGPIVAEDPSDARNLLSHCLATQTGRTLAVDVPRLSHWVQWLESVGFKMERPFLRMRRGDNLHPGLPALQFGIAGPEFG